MWIPQGIYADFLLKQPTIFFGKDGVRGLFNFPGHKIAVIYGKGMEDSLSRQLRETFKKRSLAFIRKSWNGEPDIEGLRGAVRELEEFGPDVILAVGGGSVIDGAKLCRAFYEFPYMDVESGRMDQLDFKTRFLAIPTTIGSGAEASSAAVYYDPEEKRKKVVVCHGLQPEAVILNPQTAAGVPENVWYASVLDALAHLIEGFVSIKKNALAEQMSIQGVRMIHEALGRDGRTAREEVLKLQFAGYMGGIVQNHCLVGAAHAMAHQMASCGYAHGEAVALFLGESIRINRKDKSTGIRYAQLSDRAGFEDTDELLDFLGVLAEKTGSDRTRAAEILKNCRGNEEFYKNVKEDPGGKGNPLPITDDYITEFIEEFAPWNI